MNIRNKTILLLEVNPSDIDLTNRVFAKEHVNTNVVVAEDVQDALDYISAKDKYAGRDENDLPVLVLLDLKLPRVDGLEVLRQIRANELTHRQLVSRLNSSKMEQDLATNYDLGVNSYIRKPVDFHQFSEAIKLLGLYWLVGREPLPLK